MCVGIAVGGVVGRCGSGDDLGVITSKNGASESIADDGVVSAEGISPFVMNVDLWYLFL